MGDCPCALPLTLYSSCYILVITYGKEGLKNVTVKFTGISGTHGSIFKVKDFRIPKEENENEYNT